MNNALALAFAFFVPAGLYAQATLFHPQTFGRGGEFGLALSPNAKQALYVQSGGKRDTLLIMESRKQGGVWSAPIPASFSVRPEWKDIDPAFSPDGSLLIFQSTRPVPGKPGRSGFDVWAVKKTSTGWGEPYNLGDSVNSDDGESSASLAANGNLYFMRIDSAARNEIWVSRFQNGGYRNAQKLPAPVNTQDRESNPFIAPDESYLLYFSDKQGGYGDVDLYISFQQSGRWTEPVNLGPAVNGPDAEFTPFVLGRRLYFSRQKKGGPQLIEAMYSVPWKAAAYRKK